MQLAAKLRTGARMARNWRYWPFMVQRQVMQVDRRARIARRIARFRPARLTTPDAVVAQQAEALGTEGIVSLGHLLTREQCAEVRAYLEQHDVTDFYDPTRAPMLPLSNERRPDCHVMFHSAKDLVNAPHLMELANSPRLLALAETVFGCRPTIGYMASWWSYPTDSAAQQAENFHRDVDDWAFLKFFVYLTDVDDDNGPHVYVRNSLNDSRLASIGRFEDHEVEATFGNNQIDRITGTAGASFIENTFGLHKGQPLKRGQRLLFQVVYSLFPLPYGPKRPVMKFADHRLSDSVDPWTNRVYLAR